jgi:gluconate 2-dehydrogenase gamma chain
MRSETLRRRRFLETAAGMAAAGSLPSCGRQKSPWRWLSVQEGALLNALCERIVPTDATPGAAWAGGVNYIDRQLGGPYRALRARYREGLQSLEQACRAAHGKGFLELPPAQQTAFLQSLKGNDAAFFRVVIDHVMQSYYGDPRHGGNRDAVSWRMLGVPAIPVRGRDQYQLKQE